MHDPLQCDSKLRITSAVGSSSNIMRGVSGVRLPDGGVRGDADGGDAGGGDAGGGDAGGSDSCDGDADDIAPPSTNCPITRLRTV